MNFSHYEIVKNNAVFLTGLGTRIFIIFVLRNIVSHNPLVLMQCSETDKLSLLGIGNWFVFLGLISRSDR